LQLILTLLYDYLNLVVNGVELGTVTKVVSEE